MTIGEEAVQQYRKSGDPDGIAAALLRCFLFGLIIKRPDFLLLAEEVLTDGERILALDPDSPKNCWWVHYLASKGSSATPFDWRNEAPFPHPYIAFKRRGKTKIYGWEDLAKEIIHGRRPKCISTTTT